ncbi:MAG: hypothetical protein ACRD2L_02100, partial [Terriglobia bacterium]
MSHTIVSRSRIFLASLLATTLITGFTGWQRLSGAGPAEGTADVTKFNPLLTFDNQGPAPKTGRLMLLTKGPV